MISTHFSSLFPKLNPGYFFPLVMLIYCGPFSPVLTIVRYISENAPPEINDFVPFTLKPSLVLSAFVVKAAY